MTFGICMRSNGRLLLLDSLDWSGVRVLTWSWSEFFFFGKTNPFSFFFFNLFSIFRQKEELLLDSLDWSGIRLLTWSEFFFFFAQLTQVFFFVFNLFHLQSKGRVLFLDDMDMIIFCVTLVKEAMRCFISGSQWSKFSKWSLLIYFSFGPS